MKAPRLRAWHKELKFMEYPESIFTRDNIHMLLNEEDYIWMKSSEKKDKNGKEIYEKDILKSPHFEGTIEYIDGQFILYGGVLFVLDDIEIIGNSLEDK